MVSIYFHTGKYYNLHEPTIADIVRMITQVQTQCPTMPIILTMRDISSAFRLSKLRTSRSLLTIGEFRGRLFCAKYDVVLFYRPIPSGWSGSPKFFSTIGDVVAVIHGESGVSRPLWSFRFAPTPNLFSDDGIYVEMSNHQRQNGRAVIWAIATAGFLAPLAISKKETRERRTMAH